jgi:hypothetical protein
VIHFPATPINDQSIAVFYVDNRHIDKNHFKHPVPRIGNGKLIKKTKLKFFIPIEKKTFIIFIIKYANLEISI